MVLIPRRAAGLVRQRLDEAPAVVLLGPRQVGKTTLARDLLDTWSAGGVYLDLERPADLRRLADADRYLRAQAPGLVVIDEVHRMPELFPVLRGVIDAHRRSGFRNGQFLLLGSASLDLGRVGAESLAGRLAHVDIGGIDVAEAAAVGIDEDTVWLRGGFPDSLLAADDGASLRWRVDLVRTYLEREVPIFAPRIPAQTLRRLWTMTAHLSGGLLNASRLAEALGVSGPTVDRYVDLLVDLGLLRRLLPWFANVGKRVTKSPKVYVRDSGLLHALLDLDVLDDVLGHPAAGASYESMVVEATMGALPQGWQGFHYRTARGDEVDLVLVRGGVPRVAVEVTRSSAPQISAGFRRASADLGVDHRLVVHPDDGTPAWPAADGVEVWGLRSFVERLRTDPW